MPASETNKALAELFRRAAKILDLKGANAFKAIAFQKVATRLDNLTDDIAALHAKGGRKAIEAVDGIGSSSAAIIIDVIETGTSSDYEALAASVPSELLSMLDVPGLGPKTVRLLWHERGIETLSGLAAALDDGSLAGLKGVGAKKIEQIREGLLLREAASKRRALGDAARLAAPLIEQLADMAGVLRVEQAGSVRRGRETIGDLDLVVANAAGSDPGTILEAFAALPDIRNVIARGKTKCSALLDDELQVDCRVVPPSSFGAALCYFTGSKAHNTHLRALARKRGMRLNEWGLYDAEAWDADERESGTAPTMDAIAGESEAEIFEALGLAWIPPELREDAGEIELAARDDLPDLVDRAHYRGDLHCHTHASDGTASILDMAEAAKALGHRYLAITDHSVSQVQANGLDARRLRAHAAAVRAANDQIKGIELLAGTECDILADGRLDYEDAVLAELDWVVASPHAALRQNRDKATTRVLRAIENPYVNAIGHPTGRLINGRAGLPLDFDAVYAAAAASGTALEINASVRRLDLSADHARAAVQAGCTLTINTDAHTTKGLDKLAFGIATARRGWVSHRDVLNCGTLGQLRRFVSRKRP